MMQTVKEVSDEIEVAVGTLYASFYKLRQLEAYKEEYSILDTIINMMIEDRFHLLQKYSKDILQ